MSSFAVEELHGSLSEPVLGSINFLNEVMTRYPDAISFAPGAPYLRHLDQVDLGSLIDRFCEYVRAERGLDESAARRLLMNYGPSSGLINDLVARALRADHQIDVPPEAIVITVGAQEAMLIVLRVLTRPGCDLLGVISPCFPGILGAASILDVEVRAFPDGPDGPDPAAVRTACALARAAGRRLRALYVAPDYANPSGTRMSLPARRRLLELADAEDLVLLEDTAYGFTAPPDQRLPSLRTLDAGGRVVQIGTFSKVCLPGARVGYLVADQQITRAGQRVGRLADALAAVKSTVTVNTSPICQAVIGGLLLTHDCSLVSLGELSAAHYRRNLELLLNELDAQLPPGELEWTRPSGGFFVLMQLPVAADLALLERSASEFGVLWTPMSEFHPEGGGDRQIRLSCSYLTPEQIRQGVGRLAAFLREAVLPRRTVPLASSDTGGPP